MEKQRLVEGLNSAVEGFLYVIKTQRNMRLHFLIATFVLVLGIYLNITKQELLTLLVSIVFVLVLEMLNTAIELTMDLVKSVYHPVVRIIKDIAAGAVFLSATNAVVVGYIIFSHRFAFQIDEGIYRISQSTWHLTFIAFLLVLLAVIIGKAFLHKGTPFRGGMPSGHAAFAFSIWTIIAFTTKHALIILLSFVLAFLIARHRLKDSIHTVWEIIAGSLLGILITTVVFQMLV